MTDPGRPSSWIEEVADKIADLRKSPNSEAEAEADPSESWVAENLRVLASIAAMPGEEPPELQAESDIGPYQILDTLGEGGMGRVLLARQEKPVRRLVALKLIRPDRATAKMRSRLEAERQALALLSHPNISRLFEAGTTDRGHPWFAMEFVSGLPIAEWCDEHTASIESRVELLAAVADAVQHAHFRGIVHRDLKPGNVLVETVDGEPFPRVIDFGIARITTDLGEDRETLLTESGHLLGTPEYMSPEQVLGDPARIDVRTDVYSLGVMLYELLTGTLPFASDRLREVGIVSLTKILTEEDPPAPSIRFRDLSRRDGVEAERMATERGTSVVGLTKSLRGELDWITLRALERDPQRRYSSSAELAADLRRALRHEAVSVGPRGRTYLVRRFVRRYRTVVAAGVTALALLIAGTATTTWQAVRARQAERQARQEQEIASSVNRVLTGMLESANPQMNPLQAGREPTISELLRATEARLREEALSPAVEVEVLRTLGNTWSALGDFARADSSFARAMEVRVRALDPVIEYELLYSAGQNALRQRDHDRGEDLVRAGLSLAEREWGRSSARGMRSMLQLAKVATRRGEFERADSLFAIGLGTRSLASLSEAERKHWSVGLHDYALLQTEVGRFASAEAAYLSSIDLVEEANGRMHPNYAEALDNYGRFLTRAGRFAEADSILTEATWISEETVGPDQRSTAVSRHNRAAALIELERFEEALALMDQSEPVLRAVFGNEHANVARLQSQRGTALKAVGDLEGASEAYREALRIAEQHGEPGQLFGDLNNLAALLRVRKEYAEAEPLFRQALALAKDVYGDEHYQVAVVANNLGKTLIDLERYEEAVLAYDEAVSVAEATFPTGHVNLHVIRGNYGYCLLRVGRTAEAETTLRAAHAALREQLGDDHGRTKQVAAWLSELPE